MVTIRPERPQDFDAARAVHEQAFGADSPEGALVEALRAEGAHVPELCLVALDGDEVVGHIVFSRARLASGHEVLALAPMAVAPGFQRAGVGSRLAREAIQRARATDYPLVVVLGHPGYYPRFGFVPAAALGIEPPDPAWGEHFQARPLAQWSPEVRGTFRYARPFDEL